MNDDTGRPVKPHRSGGGLRQTPAEIPLPNYTRDRCAVRGLVRPGGMCASVIVGGEFCGYGGECEHKVPNAYQLENMMAAEDTQIGGNHYASKKVQPWHAMEAWMTRDQFAGFLRGNAIKYLARCDDKGGLEDLKKARHYLDKLIEFHSNARTVGPDAALSRQVPHE